MGEVFLARDTRLGRDVALKVLPRELAANPTQRTRLEREARAISALSHPHVCALFDVGHTDEGGGIDYLVMERLEGETLAARLTRGPLPLADTLALGGQLAGALAAAHRRGIVHRDLKPGNVMLTRSGAKLLDFGLAQLDDAASETGAEGAQIATEATKEAPLTREGAVAGTWPYLAPERLRGDPADARSDIFALGCVLFEAISGGRAFPGNTRAEISAAILVSEPPDLRARAPAAPGALVAVVSQCLAPDPDARWQRADDVARGLRVVEEGLARPGVETKKRPRSRWALAALGAALVAAGVSGWLLAGRPTAREPLRFSVNPPPGVVLPRPGAATGLVVSPDGRRIACVASAGGVGSLHLWSAEDGLLRPIEDTNGAVGPFFSPDGREIAFFAGGDLRRVPIAGGPATTIAKASRGSSGTWLSDGTIVFMRPFAPEAGLYAVPARGGEARALLETDSPTAHWGFPRSLPGGRHYLVQRWGRPVGERELCIASLDGGEPDCFASCHSQGEYSASGHVLCVRGGTLVAVPFDAGSRRPTGEPITLARDVRWFGPSGSAQFAVSAGGGTLVYEPRPALARLVWFDRSGRETGTLGEPGAFASLQLAPDGRRVAVDAWHPDGRGRDIWSFDTRTGVATRLTAVVIDAFGPAWAPDGRRLAFVKSDEGGAADIAVLRLDGSAREDWLLRSPGVQVTRHWSPDGRLVTYDDQHTTGGFSQRHVWLTTLAGEARRLTSTPFNSYHGRFAPDGRALAYVSEESGRPEIYLADLASQRPPRRVSRAGGVLPRFRADGSELFYFQPDGMMMVVALADEAAAPRSLFHLEGVTHSDFDYDVGRDGQRFLARYSTEAEGSKGLRVVMGWSRSLEVAGPARSE